MVTLSNTQNAIRLAVKEWHKNEAKKKQIYRIFGYAGTGKSTIAKAIAEEIVSDESKIAYMSFTGKASLVMKKKGCEGATTIHSKIYKPVEQDDGSVQFVLNRSASVRDAELIVVDECSMVNETLGMDLRSFGVPILVLGDPAQLPPPDGAGYFTNHKPDSMMTEIHRQSAGNPIIELATAVRRKEHIAFGKYGDSRVISSATVQDMLDCDQLLVGRNITRESMNRNIRRLLGFEGELPQVNERLICLKNDKDLGIYNGGMFNVADVNSNYKSFMKMKLNSIDEEDRQREVRVHKSSFDFRTPKPAPNMMKGYQDFAYGYAITTHKSQGSQWDNVAIFDESYCFRDEASRWLYTAITRAAERVTVIRD